MPKTQSRLLPTWSPRVKQRLVRRLYESDAQGLIDEELLDEVGWGLYSRCKDFIEANAAVNGRAECPGRRLGGRRPHDRHGGA